MKFLIDSDFLIALIKQDDNNHQKAIEKLKNLQNEIIYTNLFVVAETATVLSYKVSHNAAKKFLKSIRYNISALPINNDIIAEADKIFISQNKNRTSWIDCLNIAMINYYKLDGILSFDKFYKKLKI